ncbi:MULTISPECIES: hypothetical protein [unclassified Bradyrhizobium]|uniref:hypothetical protein n=1 Tax=unclassified Bradyrhizobium TaxID=2631580 RepID=UPI00247A1BFC|nr:MULTISPECIES: hypothetical protein [unclassified Bradyrhizobium]WGR69525.1 hypothetical protein MTX24_29460 [Bradyrhizobium sp. ISRA426]WGR81581.1 hypothetical protein MTX21_14570 [Bradyrhizobium sp. ISRA430]WGR84765.1 hypothetical protein MTX25_29135 [Bradyrhizobium sp. ISRA432]
MDQFLRRLSVAKHAAEKDISASGQPFCPLIQVKSLLSRLAKDYASFEGRYCNERYPILRGCICTYICICFFSAGVCATDATKRAAARFSRRHGPDRRKAASAA